MVRKPLLLVLLFAGALAWADSGFRPPAVTVSEVDGNPKRRPVQELEFSNGTVTITGNKATIVTGGGGAATVQIPQTAVAVGTSSNTVTGSSTTFRADLTNGQVYIKNVTGSTTTLILDVTGFALNFPVITFRDNGADEFSWRYSQSSDPEARLYLKNDQTGTELLNFSRDASSMTALQPIAFRGTVRVSSGVLDGNGSAGTARQVLTSGGSGGKATWTTKHLVQEIICSTTAATTTTTSNTYQRDVFDCRITPQVVGSTIVVILVRNVRTDNSTASANRVTVKRDDGSTLTDIALNSQPLNYNTIAGGIVDLTATIIGYDVTTSSGTAWKYIPYFNSSDNTTTVRMGWGMDNGTFILREYE